MTTYHYKLKSLLNTQNGAGTLRVRRRGAVKGVRGTERKIRRVKD